MQDTANKKRLCRSRAVKLHTEIKSALGELGSIAGRAAPCTRCLSKDL
nr:MAG TPA: hypothetical protein [Caudoviricetes sp.]